MSLWITIFLLPTAEGLILLIAHLGVPNCMIWRFSRTKVLGNIAPSFVGVYI